MSKQDPGSTLRGIKAMLRWQIRKAKTPAIRGHLERAFAEVVEADRKEQESGEENLSNDQ
jgi:hypothetical protein